MNGEALDKLCIGHLQARGFIVTKAEEFRGWVAPKKIAELAGLSGSGLWRRLHHKDCPPFESETGSGGRIVRLRPTPALLAFLTQPKRQGEPMTPAHLIEPDPAK